MRLVAVDPSTEATGVATFEDGKLIYVEILRGIGLGADGMIFDIVMSLRDYDSDDVIIESPTVYRRGGKGDANDLIPVAIIAGAAACALVNHTRVLRQIPIEFVEPRTWKGSVPKDIQNKRDLKKLSPEELELFHRMLRKEPRGLINNAADAVGIGLYKLGRS